MTSDNTMMLLLTLLTVVTTLQFLLLVALAVRMQSSLSRLREAVAPLVGRDVVALRGRAEQLLSDLEVVIARGDRILATVERGATGLETAALVAGATARRAITGSSLQARAAATGLGVGVRWLLGRRARRAAGNMAS